MTGKSSTHKPTETDESTMNGDEYVEVAKASASAGAAVAEQYFRTAMDVERKGEKTDVVTEADRKTQERIVAEIVAEYPDAAIVGEENEMAGSVPTEGMVWIIDPIDGTHNFVRGNRYWATSVVCVIDGEPVAAVNMLPEVEDTFVGVPGEVTRNGEAVSVSDRRDPELFVVVPTIWWGFDRREEYAKAAGAIVKRFGDLRRIGSAQSVLSMLAAGVYEGVITNVETNPWDTVAGVAMVRWAGGTVTDLDGNQWEPDSTGLVASNGQAHVEMLAAARDIRE
jgi:myo-inositol-1(or 4)-monophosphatase